MSGDNIFSSGSIVVLKKNSQWKKFRSVKVDVQISFEVSGN